MKKELVENLIKKWYYKYPANYPIVISKIKGDSKIANQTIIKYVNANGYKTETLNCHKIRIMFESILKTNDITKYIYYKDIGKYKETESTYCIYQWFRDNPDQKALLKEHNDKVKQYRLEHMEEYNREYAKKYQVIYNRKNRKKINEYYRNYYHNPETGYKEKQTAYAKKRNTIEKRKEYYEKNKDRILALCKINYEEKKKEYNKEYYQKNKEQKKDYYRNYYQKNKEAISLKYFEKKNKGNETS